MPQLTFPITPDGLVMGSGPRGKVVRKVFHKATVLHLPAFLFKEDAGAERFVRSLDCVARKYWRVL
jgi:hypothetical protein